MILNNHEKDLEEKFDLFKKQRRAIYRNGQITQMPHYLQQSSYLQIWLDKQLLDRLNGVDLMDQLETLGSDMFVNESTIIKVLNPITQVAKNMYISHQKVVEDFNRSLNEQKVPKNFINVQKDNNALHQYFMKKTASGQNLDLDSVGLNQPDKDFELIGAETNEQQQQ